MITIADLLAVKGNEVHAIAPAATVYEAIEKMVRLNVGALVAVEEGKVAGMITERDYLRRVAVEGRTSKMTAVRDIMVAEPTTVAPNATVERCMQIMTERRIRHLPVLVGGRLTGIVSIGDIVKWLLRDRETHIQSLTEYIQGRA